MACAESERQASGIRRLAVRETIAWGLDAPRADKMSVQKSVSFGAMLRHGRVAAGLTQEVLAERSGLGLRTIQGLERGETQPRRETLRRLTKALQLTAEEAGAFELSLIHI